MPERGMNNGKEEAVWQRAVQPAYVPPLSPSLSGGAGGRGAVLNYSVALDMTRADDGSVGGVVAGTPMRRSVAGWTSDGRPAPAHAVAAAAPVPIARAKRPREPLSVAGGEEVDAAGGCSRFFYRPSSTPSDHDSLGVEDSGSSWSALSPLAATATVMPGDVARQTAADPLEPLAAPEPWPLPESPGASGSAEVDIELRPASAALPPRKALALSSERALDDAGERSSTADAAANAAADSRAAQRARTPAMAIPPCFLVRNARSHRVEAMVRDGHYSPHRQYVCLASSLSSVPNALRELSSSPSSPLVSVADRAMEAAAAVAARTSDPSPESVGESDWLSSSSSPSSPSSPSPATTAAASDWVVAIPPSILSSPHLAQFFQGAAAAKDGTMNGGSEESAIAAVVDADTIPSAGVERFACYETLSASSTNPLAPTPRLITPEALSALLSRSTEAASVLLLDVRTEMLYEFERVRGAVHLPPARTAPGSEVCLEPMLRRLHTLLEEASTPRTVVVYDQATSQLDAAHSVAASLVDAICRTRCACRTSVTSVALVAGGYSRIALEYPQCTCGQQDHLASKRFRRKLRRRLGAFFERFLSAHFHRTQCPPSQILPFLYVGNDRDAANWSFLQQAHITHVLMVGFELKAHFPGAFRYHQLRVLDSVEERLDAVFPQIFQFIDQSRSDDAHATVLVHCFAGVSRSVSAVLAYLVHSGWTLRTAWALMRERRAIVQPNPAFWGQLRAYEHQRHGQCSVDAEAVER
ncbi:hypothetical protein CDCA_CDCA04G1170 [Cyanidium caldarium]|uniref:protein-tyrosine-phosphatase n=1 Tax=Cyanidium caldarium TaxID=2771 RepID=A0AAV9IS68_CYACA|nr:hypothetical protein CDCA_CDCA04G1170 [Cyanidium caldarium]